MFTTNASTHAIGVARPESAVVMSASGMRTRCETTASATTSWYRLDGFGFPVDHKRHTRRPPSPTT